MTPTTAPEFGAAAAVVAPAPARWRRALSWHFARHYLEMLLSMVAGMELFGWLEGFLPFDLMARTDVGALVMATNMSLGMGIWMKIRGHSWRSIGDMTAAMYVPFAVLLVPFWAGLIPGGTVMVAGHALMLPAMALVMLWRPGH